MIVGTPTKLNLIPSGVMPVVYINQGDAGYDKEFLIYNGDTPYNVPSGVSATIRGTKADGFGVTEAAEVTEDSNLVTVTITEQMVAAAGANLYELVFVDTNDLRVASINMIWTVKRDALGDSVISDSDLDYVNQAMNKIQGADAMRNQISANEAAINAETAARIAANTSLQTAITSEASVRSATDASLQSQINQLIAPTGTAPSAAEIENARIGADGITYDTLGNAIRTQVSNIDATLGKILDTRNLLTLATFVRGKYYWGAAYNGDTFGYFVVPVVSGATYTFRCGVRFMSTASAGFDNTPRDAGYQYTADFTGDLYVTLYLAEEQKWAMCLSVYDVMELGTVQSPRLAQGLLAQESGESETLAMSQNGVTNVIAVTAVQLDGEGQVTPENIEGVTVIGGNALDKATRLYCSQAGKVGNDGYATVTTAGAFVQYLDSYCTFLLPVKPNSTYTANNEIRFMVLLGSNRTSGTTPVTYIDVIGSLMTYVSTFNTGDAKFALVSWNYGSYPINDFVISKGTVAKAEKTVNLPDWWTGGSPVTVKPKYVSATGNLASGASLKLLGYKQNLRKGERYVFSGNINTFSTLTFGFTSANSFSAADPLANAFIIDNEKIIYKTDSTNANPTLQYAHGLTLANNIQFIFEYLPEGNAKITLISNGMMFTQTLLFIKQTISQVVVLSTGSTLTDCKLTWTPIDIDKPIWMFGDSYFAYSAARWTYYLQQYGYAENALIDGFPGEGSVNARNSLMTLIQFGTPKYIVWCMGMNDGSDTDASTPSSEWATRRDEMLNICNSNGITPIFATIPNVPSILNTGKNAWVKASGYRYIDFAAAVGAESAGSTWFSGMLSSDNIHPSESGAKALFARALLDFPEIMVNE